MNVEDREHAKRMRAQRPNLFAENQSSTRQIKLVFVAVAAVTVTWVAVLFYLGRELIARAFG